MTTPAQALQLTDNPCRCYLMWSCASFLQRFSICSPMLWLAILRVLMSQVTWKQHRRGMDSALKKYGAGIKKKEPGRFQPIFFLQGSRFTNHFWTHSWRRIWSLPSREERSEGQCAQKHLVLRQVNRTMWKGSDYKKPWELPKGFWAVFLPQLTCSQLCLTLGCSFFSLFLSLLFLSPPSSERSMSWDFGDGHSLNSAVPGNMLPLSPPAHPLLQEAKPHNKTGQVFPSSCTWHWVLEVITALWICTWNFTYVSQLKSLFLIIKHIPTILHLPEYSGPFQGSGYSSATEKETVRATDV